MPSIRKTVASTLYNLALEDTGIVAMTADLAESVGFDKIREKLPNQFVEAGIAEQELMSMAAGFSLSGKKPVAGSYAAFHPGRNWDQLRTSVCYNHTPVRIISSHYGLSVGGDGATHQCLEYLSLTLCLPHLRVFMPFNTASSQWCTEQIIIENFHPSILFQPRMDHREELDNIELGDIGNNGFVFLKNEAEAKALVITAGLISDEALKVFEDEETPCDIVFLVDFTSYDQEKLAKLIYAYSKTIIVEEHQEFGGLGSLIYGLMARYRLARDIRHLCIRGDFGKSARDGKDLWLKYHIDNQSIKQHILD